MAEIHDIPNDFEDLKKYAPTLFSMERKNIFEVPLNYFDELPTLIQSKVFLSGLKQPQALEVPQGYFNELPAMIQSLATIEAHSKENPFAVPSDYFDYLPARIQDRIIESKRNRLAEWLSALFAPRYLVPATLSITLIIVGFFYLNNQHTTIQQPVQLSQLEKKEVFENTAGYNIDESSIGDELLSENSAPEKATSLDADKNDIADYLIENSTYADITTMIKDI